MGMRRESFYEKEREGKGREARAMAMAMVVCNPSNRERRSGRACVLYESYLPCIL
jgi:hypothetical protein